MKLVRDPKQFVRDSPIGKASYAIRGQSDPASSFGLDLGRKQEDLKPRQERITTDLVKERIASHASVFFLDDESCEMPAVCALKREYAELIQAILRVCAEESLLLSYFEKERVVVPRTVRDAVTALEAKSVSVLRLADKRSSAVLFLEVQEWKEFGQHVLAPKKNAVSTKVWKRSLNQHELPRKDSVGHLQEILAGSLEDEPQFEIDFVYTWVDSEDPEWQQMYAKYRPDADNDASSLARFYNRNELMFSLRSLELYAPWVRKVHIVSNCAAPAWLDTENKRVSWVSHEEIFDSAHLPTFSSHAIESRLHRIPGLSKYFVYSNDDFLLTRPARKSDFFESNGICRLKLEEWGSVNGEPKEGEADYLNGARNCQRLIERDFGVSPTQLHCHAPQALRIDILEEMEERYAAAFELTARARFRAVTDVAVTGFFFHHYAYVTGRALKSDAATMLIQQNHNYTKKYSAIAAEVSIAERSARHLSICVNDGADSHLNARWNRVTEQFLVEYFREKSSFER